MPYLELYYHLVWATKGREPWITRSLESWVHDLIRAKGRALGAGVFAVGGTEDHIHMVSTIPPKVPVARFVGQVKAVSSKRINEEKELGFRFAWQSEYGALTFDKKRLPHYIAYAENQRAHHGAGSIIPALERVRDAPVG